MKHSNIVSYQESFEGWTLALLFVYMKLIIEAGKLFIAMDYCDGGMRHFIVCGWVHVLTIN